MFLAGDNENIGSAGRLTEFPNILCDPNQGSTRTVTQWINTACFATPAFGTLGSGNKHAYYSDPLVNWDASIAKQWPFGEGRRVEFRTEFFDLPNSHTFDPPWSEYPDPTFGVVSGTRQGGRNVQFALKIHW